MKKIGFTFVLMILIGCNSNFHYSENVNISVDRELVYKVGYPVNHKFSGIYFHKQDSSENIYFGDVATNKCIDIFSYEGVKRWHIPLNNIAKLTGIDNFTIISPDTILVLGDHTNQIYFLNQKGQCWRSINLDSLVIPPTGTQFYYASSIYDVFYSNNNLFLRCYQESHNNGKLSGNLVERTKYIYKLKYDSPFLLKIENIFSSHPKCSLGMESFYYNITDTMHLVSELPFYCTFNNSVGVFSIYSNQLFIINQKDFKIIKKIKISSDYTPIGLEPIPINENSIYKIQDLVNAYEHRGGTINRFFYDKYKNLFYVFVYHLVSDNIDSENIGTMRAWSLIILNENLIQLSEVNFPEHTYSPGYSIVCKEGILISDNLSNRKDYDPGKARFKLFKVTAQ